MNNWCVCWFFTRIFTGILIFKGLIARRLYKSFGVKGLMVSSTELRVIRETAGGWDKADCQPPRGRSQSDSSGPVT
jgi:hypothetical protein